MEHNFLFPFELRESSSGILGVGMLLALSTRDLINTMKRSRVSHRSLSPEGSMPHCQPDRRFPDLSTLGGQMEKPGLLLPPNPHQISSPKIPPATRFPQRVVLFF